MQPPPEPMTNVFDEFPEMIDDIRKEAESEADMPELPEIDSEAQLTIDEKFYDAYEDWKNPDTEGSWQSFVKVCGGPVKAKEYRELIEANLPPSDGNTSP